MPHDGYHILPLTAHQLLAVGRIPVSLPGQRAYHNHLVSNRVMYTIVESIPGATYYPSVTDVISSVVTVR